MKKKTNLLLLFICDNPPHLFFIMNSDLQFGGIPKKSSLVSIGTLKVVGYTVGVAVVVAAIVGLFTYLMALRTLQGVERKFHIMTQSHRPQLQQPPRSQSSTTSIPRPAIPIVPSDQDPHTQTRKL